MNAAREWEKKVKRVEKKKAGGEYYQQLEKNNRLLISIYPLSRFACSPFVYCFWYSDGRQLPSYVCTRI